MYNSIESINDILLKYSSKIRSSDSRRWNVSLCRYDFELYISNESIRLWDLRESNIRSAKYLARPFIKRFIISINVRNVFQNSLPFSFLHFPLLLLSSISIISRKKLPSFCTEGRKEGGKKRKFHYRSALSIYTHHSPRFTHEHGSVVAHSSLVTVTIDSLTRSRPLIRDAIDSREGENRVEGVRIREENSPPLFNQKIVDEDVKNFRVEIVRSLFLRNREPLFLVVFLRF